MAAAEIPPACAAAIIGGNAVRVLSVPVSSAVVHGSLTSHTPLVYFLHSLQ